MKSLKKILAFAISLCLLIGAVPMFAMADDTATETPAITYTYENDMSEIVSDDGYSNIYKLGEDFSFRFDFETSLYNDTTYVKPEDVRYYTMAQEGKLLRQANANEWKTDPCRAFVNQLFMYHKRALKNFEASVEFSSMNPSAFNLIHFSPSATGNIYSEGFVVGIRGTKLYFDTYSNAKTGLKEWHLDAGSDITLLEGNVINVKVVMQDGSASVYANDTLVKTLTGLATDKYYIGYSLGHAGGCLDNIKITSTDADEGWVREESEGVYKNNFNTSDWQAFDDDFVFGHNPAVTAVTKVLDVYSAEDAIKYYYTSQGNFQRRKTPTENGVTRAMRGFYAYYKNQTFNEFELEADTLITKTNSFQWIHFSPNTTSTIFNTGFYVGLCNNGGTLRVGFGDAANANSKMHDWTLFADNANMYTTTTTPAYATGDIVKVKVVLSGTTATLYLNGTKIKAITAYANNYYVGFGSAVSTGWFDNLSIVETTAATDDNNRVEKDGSYINNFNNISKNELANDFAMYYDPQSSANDGVYSLVDAGLGTTYNTNLFTVGYDNLFRIYNSSIDKEADGNRPYSNQLYYTYKNQAFKNYTLNVDLKIGGTCGTSFFAITLGEMGKAINANGGYTLVLQNGNTNAWFGASSKLASQINWAMSGSLYAYTKPTDGIYSITIAVADGLATVSIEGVAIATDIEVGEVSGYISLLCGRDGSSYFDNLSIVGDSNLSFAGNDGKTAALYATDVEGLEEIGYELAIGDKTVKVTADKIDPNAWCSAPFAVTKDGEVYYTDLDMSGEYDADDIVAFRQWFVYLAEVDTELADLNKDNEVDIRDLVRMKKIEVNAADGYTPNENGYTFAFSFAAALEGVDGDVTATPYYVANGNTIYGDAETFTVADGAIEA